MNIEATDNQIHAIQLFIDKKDKIMLDYNCNNEAQYLEVFCKYLNALEFGSKKLAN